MRITKTSSLICRWTKQFLRGNSYLGAVDNRCTNHHVKKKYSTCPQGMKVTICGAAGCTGKIFKLSTYEIC